MGVSIQYEPLYGVKTPTRSVCSILTVDGYKILLDCGWDSSFDESSLGALPTRAGDIDAVLLSHADITHLGALPAVISRHGLKAPVYSTLPVWRLGQLFLYDAYRSITATRAFDSFNLDDVDAAFDIDLNFTQVKYQQCVILPRSAGTEITITPHPAGHMLGGAVWVISAGTEEVVYAPAFNHRLERHLRPFVHQPFMRPSHFIVPAARVQERAGNTSLPQVLTSALGRGGHTLIPVDSAGRVLELAVTLIDEWANIPALRRATLVVLNEFAAVTFEFSRSMIEWMSEDVVKRFDVARDNMFDFKNRPVKVVAKKSELDAIRGQKVVLAATSSMQYGFSRQLFVEWAADSRNTIVLSDVAEPGTLAHELHERVRIRRGDEQFDITVRVEEKVPLAGEELAAWREEQRKIKEAEEEEQRKKEEAERLANQPQVDGDGDVQMDGGANATSGTMADNATVPQRLASPGSSVSMEELDDRGLGRLESSLSRFEWARNPQDRVLAGEWPEQPKWDEYGQIIDTTRFMIGEDPGEGAPEQMQDLRPGAQGELEDVNEVEQIPTKDVANDQVVRVACAIHVVDCSGLSDGESLRRLVKLVEPRRVVVINGTPEQTSELRQFVLESLFSGGEENVVCPDVGQVADITSHIAVQDMVLDDSLVDALQWATVGSNAVALVDAVLANAAQELQLDREHIKQHPTLFIGTIMLNRLRDKLADAKLTAYIAAGGVLCVENENTGAVIHVKKVAAQTVTVEGAWSQELMIAREVLYKQLVVPM